MVEHTFSKILLLAESTDEGMEAARSAIALAGDEEATLLILSVVDSHTLKQLLKNRIFVEDEMEQYEQDLEKSAQKQLNYVAQLASKAKVEHRTSLVRGACHTSVLNKQKETQADLLIMGTYRATTVKTELMGREKQLIIDEIPCPVLLVPK
ncbi:MAG: universal stress protein [Candidatus Brocadiia bacterium]